MTTPVPHTLTYSSGSHVGTCPLCRARPTSAKRIYGHPVCKKCYYAFANRRQLGYIVDGLCYLPIVAVIYFADQVLGRSGINAAEAYGIDAAIGLAFACLFVSKDGFGGRSPGKAATGVRVLDNATGQPIGFGQSFKRNAVLLAGNVPVVGPLALLVIEVVIALQVAKGYRLGDRYAGTRVIWVKYARLPVFGGTALACESCGYDLVGNASGVCPECGTPVSPANAARLTAVTVVA